MPPEYLDFFEDSPLLGNPLLEPPDSRFLATSAKIIFFQ